MKWERTNKRIIFWTALAIILEIVVVLWPLTFAASNNEYMAMWEAALRGRPLPSLGGVGIGLGIGLAVGLIGGIGFGFFASLIGGFQFDLSIAAIYGIGIGIFGGLIGGVVFSIGISVGGFIGFWLGKY